MHRSLLAKDAAHHACACACVVRGRQGLNVVEPAAEVIGPRPACDESGHFARHHCPDPAQIRVAQPRRALGHRFEHRLQIERGPADDLQHLGDRGLLLERHFRLAREAHVLHRDRRLIRERLDQLDLPVTERARLRPPHRDDAHRCATTSERYRKERSETAELLCIPVRVRRVRVDIRDVDGRAGRERASRRGADVGGPDGIGPLPFTHGLGLLADRRRHPQDVTVGLIDETVLRPRDPRRVPDDRVEDRLDLERALRGDTEHFRRGGLALERLLRLVEEAHVLDRDHRLIRERPHQGDLAIGEWPHHQARHDQDPDRRAVAKHRNGEQASRPDRLRHRRHVDVRRGGEIRKVDHFGATERK